MQWIPGRPGRGGWGGCEWILQLLPQGHGHGPRDPHQSSCLITHPWRPAPLHQAPPHQLSDPRPALSTHLPYQGTQAPAPCHDHTRTPPSAWHSWRAQQTSAVHVSSLNSAAPRGACPAGTELEASSKLSLSFHGSGPFQTLVPLPQIPLTHRLWS